MLISDSMYTSIQNDHQFFICHIKKCVVYSDHHTFQVQMHVNKHFGGGGGGLILSTCACNVGSYVTSIWQHNVM